MMESLEGQVSDLRTFLTQAPPLPMGAGAATSPRHPSNPNLNASSLFSAPGDNSAHHQHHQQHQPFSSPLPPQPTSLSGASPGAASSVGAARGPSRSGSVVGPGAASSSSSQKRKADAEDLASNNGKQQRSKRNRYISIACNECKRRKIKCNGETPCQRCGNLNLACLYAPNCCSNNFKDSDEFRRMSDDVTRLQEQVNSLYKSMDALRQETLRLAPIQNRALQASASPNAVSPSPPSSVLSPNRPELAPLRHQAPSFRGPTSIAFTVDVAKNTLHNMGYSGGPDNGPDDPPRSLEETLNTASEFEPRRPPDPLWDYDKDEMIRLCRLHEEEVGIMYPVVNIESVIAHAKFLSSWLGNIKQNGLAPPFGMENGISDIKSLQLKIIMCCALVVEEHGDSAKATRLYESIQPVADKMLMNDPGEIKNLPFLALIAGYRFLSNEEVLAWRVMGEVARHCLELGLHRREGLARIEDEEERKNALNTFWTAYVLDRRWSFGTGLPYVVHDDKIDPKLPYPEEYPYLVAMITYSKLGAKIWKLVDYFEPALIQDVKRDEFESLDREILQWYDTVPDDVKINNFDRDLPLPSTPAYNVQRLQVWTRLRLNQIRIWLHTPVLHSASSIHDNMHLAQRVVDLAKETIRYLTRLHNSTNLYRRIQVFYHQFLTSAIAVLFLASTHAPLQFSANCRAEFYMGLDLVKEMSARSWVSQRLWRTIKSLKAYAPRLGLGEDGSNNGHRGGAEVSRGGSADAHSSAALAMAGLAAGGPGQLHHQHPHHHSVSPGTASMGSPATGGNSSGNNHFPRPGSMGPTRQASLTDDQHNGLRIHNEMSKIFEGYMGAAGGGGYRQQQQHQHPHQHHGQYGNGGTPYTPSEVHGGGLNLDPDDDEGVYTRFKDMF